MKLAWLTDIHLNFLEKKERDQFYEKIIESASDVVLISGDIAEAPTVTMYLQEMVTYIGKPIYFVLGNHDYYHGDTNSVRSQMRQLTRQNNLLKWLPACGAIPITKQTILIGQDGWADGQYGNYFNSPVVLNDSRLIIDLLHATIQGKPALLSKMQQLANHDAECLAKDLMQAIKQDQPKKIIILTHVPPFKEACLYREKISDDDWLPFYSAKASGDVLEKIAKQQKNIEFLVLCGHTHSYAEYQPLHNLIVKVGHAEYYYPQLQCVLKF
ncbi:MAG: metallophosphoesterase [Pseudomonadota bacterium]